MSALLDSYPAINDSCRSSDRNQSPRRACSRDSDTRRAEEGSEELKLLVKGHDSAPDADFKTCKEASLLVDHWEVPSLDDGDVVGVPKSVLTNLRGHDGRLGLRLSMQWRGF